MDAIVIIFSRYYSSKLICLYKETAWLHPAVNNDDINSHKQFLIEFVNSLILRAKKEDKKHSVTRQATPVEEVEPVIHLDRI